MSSVHMYLRVVRADIKLAGDVDKPLLSCVKVRDTDTPRAINDIHQVIYSCTAACTHMHTHTL